MPYRDAMKTRASVQCAFTSVSAIIASFQGQSINLIDPRQQPTAIFARSWLLQARLGRYMFFTQPFSFITRLVDAGYFLMNKSNWSFKCANNGFP